MRIKPFFLYTTVVCFLFSCNSATTKKQEPQNISDHTTEQVSEDATTQPPTTHSNPTELQPAATIPDFTFYRLNNGMRFERDELSFKNNIVFIFFDPSCVQCQHEARDIAAHFDEVKLASFYFVSMNDPALVNAFLPNYAPTLTDKDNVIALYDRDQHFINKIHMPTQYPSTYIYGSDGKLKTYWNGHKDIVEIIKEIQK